MTRHITAAEARALRENATPGPYFYNGQPERAVYSDSCEILAESVHPIDGPLFAAAPDLVATVEALEAERDALRAAARQLRPVLEALAVAMEAQRGFSAAMVRTQSTNGDPAAWEHEKLAHAVLGIADGALTDSVHATQDAERAAIAVLREAAK